MSERVTIGDCVLILGDCRDHLAGLSVDAVVTDPPYEIKACNRSDGGVGSISSGSKFYGRQAWDLEPPPREVFDRLLALNVPTVIWGGNHFGLPAASCYLVWDKQQRDFTFADAELAWTNLNRAVRVFDYGRAQLVREGKVHPAQKPVPLMRWCIELATKPGDRIFDPFMGSGTTGVAAIQAGRRFIGIERDPQHFATAVARVRAAHGEGGLFDPRQAPTTSDLFAATEPS